MIEVPLDDPGQASFAPERERLLAALGRLTEGGIVERVEPIGVGSLPGPPAAPPLEIALAAWPFPLEPPHLVALAALGYTPEPDFADPGEQWFRHVSGAFRLCVFEPGSESLLERQLLRDYLRQDGAARRAWLARQPSEAGQGGPFDLPEDVAFFQSILAAARRWWVEHHGFSPLEAVAAELADFPQPWYISSGWALDLFVGYVSRPHQDVDVVLPRAAQLDLQAYLTGRGWKLLTPFEGRLEPWPTHMRLELPRHQVHAHREGAFIDFLLTDIAAGVWRYRRDPRLMRDAERMSLKSAGGLPYLAPELVLLFKSKNTGSHERSKDQADFERVYRQLEPERRAWLYWALTATQPQHPWLELLH
jgi:hypothetical protein